jgi:hypothetical protein
MVKLLSLASLRTMIRDMMLSPASRMGLVQSGDSLISEATAILAHDYRGWYIGLKHEQDD